MSVINDSLARLRSMADWRGLGHLSKNDRVAIQWALDELERLRRLEAAVLVRKDAEENARVTTGNLGVDDDARWARVLAVEAEDACIAEVRAARADCEPAMSVDDELKRLRSNNFGRLVDDALARDQELAAELERLRRLESAVLNYDDSLPHGVGWGHVGRDVQVAIAEARAAHAKEQP